MMGQNAQVTGVQMNWIAGDRIIATKDFDKVKKGDVGVVVKHNQSVLWDDTYDLSFDGLTLNAVNYRRMDETFAKI